MHSKLNSAQILLTGTDSQETLKTTDKYVRHKSASLTIRISTTTRELDPAAKCATYLFNLLRPFDIGHSAEAESVQ